MNKIWQFLKYCSTMYGRVARLPYVADMILLNLVLGALFFVGWVVILAYMFFIDPATGGMLNIVWSFAMIPLQLFTFWAGICFLVRRLHDLGRPGWHAFLFLIPFYNIYLALILLFKRGDYGANTYGHDPGPFATPRQTFWRWVLVFSPPVLIMIVWGAMITMFFTVDPDDFLTEYGPAIEQNLAKIEQVMTGEFVKQLDSGIAASDLVFFNGLKPETRDDFFGSFKAAGIGSLGHPKKLEKELKEISQAGSPKASTALGLMYYHGYGVTKSFTKAGSFFEYAAKMNDPIGSYYYGLMSLRGTGDVPLSMTKAVQKIFFAARSGLVEAQLDLGNIYMQMDNEAIAGLSWMLTAAESGDRTAIESVSRHASRMTQSQINAASSLASQNLN